MDHDEIEKLIEPHFSLDLHKEKYELVEQDAECLLSHSRFDLAFKLFYLNVKSKNENLANYIYSEHIRAFSLGKFDEPGNEEKNSLKKFIEDFNTTFNSIETFGFDSAKTIIPLSKNGSISNGAHRVASAIYLDKKVTCVELDTENHIYDYDFFYKRGVSSEVLDIIATTFIEYTNNLHIAFLWPTGINKDEEIKKTIPNIVYKKTIKLTPNGAHNLLSQIYYGEEWLGSVEDDFKGSKGKLVECFKTFDSFDVIAFQANSLKDVLVIKDNIRELFNIGKHSVHITDTKEEALRVARTVFNENTLHFLNYAKPNKYLSTHKKIDEFKAFLFKNKIEVEDTLIDSSLILSCYGLREAKDTDFFYYKNNEIKFNVEDINIHDEELKYYKLEKEELIYNPKNYFYFNDIKFISFEQLYKMKTLRAEEKDNNDCSIMEAMLENNRLKELTAKLKQKILYFKIKLKIESISFLSNLGIYELIRKILKGPR